MKAGLFAHVRSLILPIIASLIVPWLVWSGSELVAISLVRGVAGCLLILAGLAMFAWTLGLFARVGQGTLAPWEPTRRLVAVGPYARVRNPMIVGVMFIIAGEATLLGSLRVGLWGVAFFAINHLYFVLSEEPGLEKRFGADYLEYKRNVPRWIPRRRPWRASRASNEVERVGA